MAYRLPDISLRRPSHASVSVALGGVSLYAQDEELLENALNLLVTAVEQTLRNHCLLTRPLLNRQANASFDTPIEERMFGAILGRCLCLGKIRSMPCLTKNNKVYRAYYHSENSETIGSFIGYIIDRLGKEDLLRVSQIRDHLFPNQEWGSWSSVTHLFAYTSFCGHSIIVDDKTYRRPWEIENALRHSF